MLTELLATRQAMDERQGFVRRRADRRHLREDWIKRQEGRVYVGQGSVTLADRHVKYVDRHSAYYPYTAGELARVYLTDLLNVYGVTRICERYRISDRERALLGILAPLYFEPTRGRDGRFIYIDIDACYFQLWHRQPLNMAYDPMSGLIGKPRPAFYLPEADIPWLRAEKQLRNAMFGMMTSHEIGWYSGGKFQHHDLLSAFTAPGLAAYVKTQLREIARLAVDEFGCRMWLTDAGIFEEGDGLSFLTWLQARGIEASIKAQGRGHLWGLGDYRVGRLATLGTHLDAPSYRGPAIPQPSGAPALALRS